MNKVNISHLLYSIVLVHSFVLVIADDRIEKLLVYVLSGFDNLFDFETNKRSFLVSIHGLKHSIEFWMI